MNTRQKGKILENYVCDQIKEKGIDNHARPSDNSGATDREKADIWTSMMIFGQNAGIECKNQKTLHIPDWWKQTKKLESLSREPILVFKEFGESLEETKCVIYLDTLLELVKNSSTEKIEIHEENNYEKKRVFENLKFALQKAIKYL
jgi:hypothetical protein